MGNLKYYDIVLTDLKLHVLKARKPKSFGYQMHRSLRTGKPGRARNHVNQISDEQDSDSFEISFPLGEEILSAQQEAARQGKKLRILFPKDGIPIFAGEDTQEYILSKKKK